VGHFPVAHHAAHFLDRTIHKGLFFGREGADRDGVQLFPVRVAGEQIGFPPGGTCFNRLFFGAGHLRHDRLVDLEQRLGYLIAAKIHQI